MKKRSEAEFRQKGDFGVQFRWKEVAKQKKPDRYHFRAIRKMLAVFRNNGNINKQNIGPTHVRSLLI